MSIDTGQQHASIEKKISPNRINEIREKIKAKLRSSTSSHSKE